MVKRASQPPSSADAMHPISVVAERTGLSRDVLRVWERRYGVVEPTRSAGGQRLYSDEDIDRFRLLAAATRGGRNISLVAGLDADELTRLVAEDEAERPAPAPSGAVGSHEQSIDDALARTRALDGKGLDRALRLGMARHGLPVFLDELVPDLMRRIGDEWAAGRLTVAHEHLASEAVLAIISEAMRAVPEVSSAPRLLVATPAGERHAVGAALAGASGVLAGWGVAYLGVDVPAADIVAAAATTEAQAVAMSLVYAENPGDAERELRAVRAQLPAGIPLIVGGAGAMAMAGSITEPGLVVCGSAAEMRTVLAGTPVAP